MKQYCSSATLIMTLFLFAIIPMYSQSLEQFPSLFGAKVGQIFSGKNNSLFYINDNYCNIREIYLSTDEGNNWSMLTTAPLNFNSGFDIGADGKIFITTNDTIYYSEDQGNQWNTVLTKPAVANSYATSLSNGNFISVSRLGIYKSNNKGLIWTKVYSLSNNDKNFKLYQVPLTNNIFLYTSTGVYYSSTGGSSWQKLWTQNFSTSYPANMLTDLNNNVYISTSTGIMKFRQTGSLIKSFDLNTKANTENSICQLPNGRLLAFDSGNNYFSDDDGQTWTELFKNQSIYYSNFLVTTNGKLLASQNGGSIFKSVDNGQSWAFSSIGIKNTNILEILAINVQSFVIATIQGYYLTKNNGQDFELIHQGKIHKSYLNYSRNAMGKINNQLVLTDIKGIYLYDLNLKTETKIRTFQAVETYFELLINESNHTIFILNGSDWSKSEDYGITWVKLQIPTATPESFDPVILNGFLFFMRGNSLFRSSDKGATWQIVSTFNNVTNSLNSIHSNQLYFVDETSTGIFLMQSFDNGYTWIRTMQHINLPKGAYYLKSFINEKAIFSLYSNLIIQPFNWLYIDH